MDVKKSYMFGMGKVRWRIFDFVDMRRAIGGLMAGAHVVLHSTSVCESGRKACKRKQDEACESRRRRSWTHLGGKMTGASSSCGSPGLG